VKSKAECLLYLYISVAMGMWGEWGQLPLPNIDTTNPKNWSNSGKLNG